MASILEDISPLLGIAAGVMGGPLAGAAVSGLLTTAKTHSLGQGLLSGVASYGLGSLASGLSSSAPAGAAGAGGDAAGSLTASGSGAPMSSTLTGAMGDAGATAANGGAGTGVVPGFTDANGMVLGPGQGYSAPDPYATGVQGYTNAEGAQTQPLGGGSASPSTTALGQRWSNFTGNLNDPSQVDWSKYSGALKTAGIGGYGLMSMQEQAANAAAANAANQANAAQQKKLHDQYLAAVGSAHQINPYSSYYQPGSVYAAAQGGAVPRFDFGGDIGKGLSEWMNFTTNPGNIEGKYSLPHIVSDLSPNSNYATDARFWNALDQPGSGTPSNWFTGGLTGDPGLYKPGLFHLAHHYDQGGSTNNQSDQELQGIRALFQPQIMQLAKPQNPGYSTGALVGDNGRWEPQEAQQGEHGIEGLLKGPGDGMSDDIPAHIEGHTPARLANDEFVIPADVVSHLGNGSTSAGAKHLYDMLDRVRKARVGHSKQGNPIDPHEHLPA